MTEGGKQLVQVLSRTIRARYLLIAQDENLKVLIALIAVIFKNWHSYLSLIESLFLNVKDKYK